MGPLLSHQDVKRQSEAVFGQFGERWIEFSQLNARLPNRRDPEELANCGVGKFCVLAAMGESLEDAIPAMKANRHKFDLVTCDKGFQILMENGIRPDFVQICDTNIPYRWLEPWVEETAGIRLLSTSYANIEWTHRWRGPVYLYVNKDALDTQKKFLSILGNPQTERQPAMEGLLNRHAAPPVKVVPAGSNVSNAMLIFMAGMDERSQVNWSGYEHYFLVGYDYSWRPPTGSDAEGHCKTGKYYAGEDPRPKRFYMNHKTMLDMNGDIVQTSSNLLFSAKWMYSYVSAFDMPVTNCSGRGILDIPRKMDFAKAMERCDPSREKRAEILSCMKDIKSAHELRVSAERRLNAAHAAIWRNP